VVDRKPVASGGAVAQEFLNLSNKRREVRTGETQFWCEDAIVPGVRRNVLVVGMRTL
jgi:hypothetical protein